MINDGSAVIEYCPRGHTGMATWGIKSDGRVIKPVLSIEVSTFRVKPDIDKTETGKRHSRRVASCRTNILRNAWTSLSCRTLFHGPNSIPRSLTHPDTHLIF